MLTEARTRDRGLFEDDAIRKLFAEDRGGRRDNGDRIWRLLTLETWQRIFVDGEMPTLSSGVTETGHVSGS
jgi:hypothetical protein